MICSLYKEGKIKIHINNVILVKLIRKQVLMGNNNKLYSLSNRMDRIKCYNQVYICNNNNNNSFINNKFKYLLNSNKILSTLIHHKLKSIIM